MPSQARWVRIDGAGHDGVGAHVVGRQGGDALALLLDLRVGATAAPAGIEQTEIELISRGGVEVRTGGAADATPWRSRLSASACMAATVSESVAWPG